MYLRITPVGTLAKTNTPPIIISWQAKTGLVFDEEIGEMYGCARFYGVEDYWSLLKCRSAIFELGNNECRESMFSQSQSQS